MWIRIQHVSSKRLRILAKTELLKAISFSNFFEIQIWVKSNKNTGVIHEFFSKSSAILYPFSGKFKKNTKKCIFPMEILNFLCPWIRIPNTDPDPQRHWIRIHNPVLKGKFHEEVSEIRLWALVYARSLVPRTATRFLGAPFRSKYPSWKGVFIS
jgi:hypothetical protein